MKEMKRGLNDIKYFCNALNYKRETRQYKSTFKFRSSVCSKRGKLVKAEYEIIEISSI